MQIPPKERIAPFTNSPISTALIKTPSPYANTQRTGPPERRSIVVESTTAARVRFSVPFGGIESRIIVAAGPRRPEAHHVARHDDDAPVLARFVGRLRDKPELDAESFYSKRSDFDPLILDFAQRREQLRSAGFPCFQIHCCPLPQVVDRG